jgi:stage III sporulation protein AG
LEGGFQSVYATEYQNGNESYVIVGSGSSAKPLFLSREAPQIAGVGIVCRGGNSASVRHELTILISAAFPVPSNRIYVTESAA